MEILSVPTLYFANAPQTRAKGRWEPIDFLKITTHIYPVTTAGILSFIYERTVNFC